MTADLYPLQVLLVTLSGWVNRYQQHVIEYLMEENRVLKEQLKGRRVRLSNEQRRRLGAKGRRLGRRVLRQVATIATPDTILRGHRQLIARKWTFTPKRPGRPGIMREISSLILRMAMENPRWGYTRIQGALKNLGHGVARNTVAKVLNDNGIAPEPDRPSVGRGGADASAPHPEGRHAATVLRAVPGPRRLQRPHDGKKRSLSLSEVREQLAATHGRLVEFVQHASGHQLIGDTRFRRRLRLDTDGHYPIHAEAIRRWRQRRDDQQACRNNSSSRRRAKEKGQANLAAQEATDSSPHRRSGLSGAHSSERT